jgi:hypothetical protein
MSSTIPIRAVLMSSEIMNGGSGFHRLVFKVDGGRAGMTSVTVMISQDAHRKLLQQMVRARCLARFQSSGRPLSCAVPVARGRAEFTFFFPPLPFASPVPHAGSALA